MKVYARVMVGAAVVLAAFSLFASWQVNSVVSLTNALANCGWYDTIVLAPGDYDLTGISMTGNAHLSNVRGTLILGSDTTSWRNRSDRRTAAVLIGDGTKSIFYTNQNAAYWEAKRGSVFQHLTFRNASNTGNGGAIRLSGESVTDGRYVCLTNCVVENCTADGSGGGLSPPRSTTAS